MWRDRGRRRLQPRCSAPIRFAPCTKWTSRWVPTRRPAVRSSSRWHRRDRVIALLRVLPRLRRARRAVGGGAAGRNRRSLSRPARKPSGRSRAVGGVDRRTVAVCRRRSGPGARGAESRIVGGSAPDVGERRLDSASALVAAPASSSRSFSPPRAPRRRSSSRRSVALSYRAGEADASSGRVSSYRPSSPSRPARWPSRCVPIGAAASIDGGDSPVAPSTFASRRAPWGRAYLRLGFPVRSPWGQPFCS